MNFEIYCDESRPELFRTRRVIQGVYVIIGGIWIEATKRTHYKDRISQLRKSHKVYSEFKWNRVSPSRLDFYLELVRLFFREEIRFRCIVMKRDEMDAVQFHQADDELMFYKFYYQLLHPWIFDLNAYRIFVDMKTNRVPNRLLVLKRVLSNANLSSEILNVQALPSKEVDLIQITDVLIGAVGYAFHDLKTSDAKRCVVGEIERFLPYHRIQQTGRGEEKFNIFRFRPGGGW